MARAAKAKGQEKASMRTRFFASAAKVCLRTPSLSLDSLQSLESSIAVVSSEKEKTAQFSGPSGIPSGGRGDLHVLFDVIVSLADPSKEPLLSLIKDRWCIYMMSSSDLIRTGSEIISGSSFGSEAAAAVKRLEEAVKRVEEESTAENSSEAVVGVLRMELGIYYFHFEEYGTAHGHFSKLEQGTMEALGKSGENQPPGVTKKRKRISGLLAACSSACPKPTEPVASSSLFSRAQAAALSSDTSTLLGLILEDASTGRNMPALPPGFLGRVFLEVGEGSEGSANLAVGMTIHRAAFNNQGLRT